MNTANTFDFQQSLLQKFPQLQDCKKASEVSKILFGVKTLTHLIDVESSTRDSFVAFFEGNASDMVAWASHCKQGYFHNFYATIAHKKVYRAMVKTFGLPLTVRLTQNRDFDDICTGVEFLKSDKKRWGSFENDILSALKLFPVSVHAVMIHDYMMQRMQNLEKRQKPATAIEVTLPDLPVKVEVDEDFKLLVPRNERDLRRIGTAQGHCVGTKGMGYASKVRRKDVYIVALYRKSLADGLCIEIDAHNASVLQAQGKHHRRPSLQESDIINSITDTLRRAV